VAVPAGTVIGRKSGEKKKNKRQFFKQGPSQKGKWSNKKVPKNGGDLFAAQKKHPGGPAILLKPKQKHNGEGLWGGIK